MPENAVTLIIEPSIKWETLLNNSFQALGRSVTCSVDQAKFSLEKHSSILPVLAELRSPSTNASTVLREPGDLLRHLQYSFLVAASRSTIFDLLERTTLSVCATKTLVKGILLVVVSGNLEQWHQAIINCSVKDASSSLRDLFNKFILHFDKQGFSSLWQTYTRSSLPDRTFLLSEK